MSADRALATVSDEAGFSLSRAEQEGMTQAELDEALNRMARLARGTVEHRLMQTEYIRMPRIVIETARDAETGTVRVRARGTVLVDQEAQEANDARARHLRATFAPHPDPEVELDTQPRWWQREVSVNLPALVLSTTGVLIMAVAHVMRFI